MEDDYIVLSLDFQKISTESFVNGVTFSGALTKKMSKAFGFTDYLEYYHNDKGYTLSLNFNKNKKVGVYEIKIWDKMIIEAVV